MWQDIGVVASLSFLIATLSGCTVKSDEEIAQEQSAEWVGKSISEVIKTESRPPSRVMELPDKSFIYIWSQDTSYTTSIDCKEGINGSTQCNGGNHVSQSCEVSALVDQQGVVTSVKSSGCTHFKTGNFRYRL